MTSPDDGGRAVRDATVPAPGVAGVPADAPATVARVTAAAAAGSLEPARDEVPGPMVRFGRFFFARRDFVFTAVFLAVLLASTPRLFLGRPAADAWMNVAGFAIALIGQILRALVIGLAYIRRGGKDRRIYAETLVQDGFFAHCRNPLYVGNMLVYLGLLVMLNSVIGWFLGAPFFLFAYLAITAAEEEYLARRFGAKYDDYCRRVPRFVPNLRGLGATVRGMRFDWKRLLRKEYGSTFAWMTVALAIPVRESVAWHGWDASRALTVRALLAWAVLVVAYAVARFLKKSRRLTD